MTRLETTKTAKRDAEFIQRGLAHHQTRQFREAEFCYQSVLRFNPDHTDALNLMGLLTIEADRYDMAIQYLSKAVRLAPRIAMYRNNLGNAHYVNSQYDEALTQLLEAVKLDSQYTDALCNLARTYRSIGDAENAHQWFTRALKVAPGLPRAKAGLAELDIELGKFEQATATFREILATDPSSIEALWGLSLARKFKATDPEIAVIEALSHDPGLRSDQKAPLLHAMGKICNDLQDWDRAIEYFIEGKKAKHLTFDLERHKRLYASLKKTFTSSLFRQRTEFGHSDERPVFIVGMPRSGTTLTEQILASHPLVHGLGELPELQNIAKSLGFRIESGEKFLAIIDALKPTASRELAARYLSVMNRVPSSALRVTDKNPHNFELLGLLALLFPKARIIHCKRNPLDTCVSCFMQSFNSSHGYNGDLATLGQYYREYESLMSHWQSVVPLPMLDVVYEDMVADQIDTSKKMLTFLGLEWDEACARYYETGRTVSTPSRWQVRQPIYQSSIKRWRRYGNKIKPLIQALRDSG